MGSCQSSTRAVSAPDISNVHAPSSSQPTPPENISATPRHNTTSQSMRSDSFSDISHLLVENRQGQIDEFKQAMSFYGVAFDTVRLEDNDP